MRSRTGERGEEDDVRSLFAEKNSAVLKNGERKKKKILATWR